MRHAYDEFLQREVAILNIGPEKRAAFEKYWRQNAVPFVGLADPDHAVAKRYQQPVRLLKLGRMPMQLVVDKKGVIRYRHEGSSMRDIPSVPAILKVFDELD